MVHTNFGGKSYGPIIGPYLFLGKFVWTNGPESSSKVSPYTGIGPWMAFPSLSVKILVRMVRLLQRRVLKAFLSGVDKRVLLQKGWCWQMFPRNENRNEGTFGCNHGSPERKPERGYVRMFSRNENRNEGTFAKATLL